MMFTLSVSLVAQEFGLSQADPALSSSQQAKQVSSTVHILSLLLRLRQCCCHLSLLKKVHTFTCSHEAFQLCLQFKKKHIMIQTEYCTQVFPSFRVSCAQTLDSSELQGDGIVLSLEEQLNALSLSSSPSPSGPDPKDTVALNGTRFPSRLFEGTSKSTKVGKRSAH